jgi:hypothetical protein
MLKEILLVIGWQEIAQKRENNFHSSVDGGA